MIKHATASVFVFNHDHEQGWRTGLIKHPIFGMWMMPGGHVEESENQQEAALREATEETGLTELTLLHPHNPLSTNDAAQVALPCWIVEHVIENGDNHLKQRHVHIDHKYVSVTTQNVPISEPAHPFRWWRRDQLGDLSMFDDTRHNAFALFDLVASHYPEKDLAGS